jgi:hypothetical protein
MAAATSVPLGSLTCPTCRIVLPTHALDAVTEAPCPGCRKPLRGRLFRAWSVAEPEMAVTPDRALEGEAVCFFHPSNRAARACDACGRFMCTICDLPVGSRHLCPSCLSSGLGKQKLPEIIPRRFLWSYAVFWLGLLPLVGFVFLWPFFFITGASTIILAIVGWNRPGSLVRGRQHWAAMVGILLGLAHLGVAIGFVSLFMSLRSK